MELSTVKGKKSYGYLPKRIKKKVNEIVDEMEQIPIVAECYDKWLELQWQVDSYYKDTRRERRKLSEEKEFTAIKNAIIQTAEHIRLGTVSFEDDGINQEDESEEFDWPSESFWKLYQIITDEEIPMNQRDGAVRKLEQLATKGDADAQYTMGKLYRDGPLLIPDWVNAAHWFDQAARQNHAAAQYALGRLLLSDDVEVQEVKAGLYWLGAAARSRNSYASYRLGKEYLSGKVTQKDAGKAAQFFLSAAEQGNQYAQYMLGKLYLTGDGVSKDTGEALNWMQAAADQKHRYAQYYLDRMHSLRAPSIMLAATQVLYLMGDIFRDRTPLPPVSGGIHIDRKRLEQMQEKRIALGHKADDHEDELDNKYQQTM